VAEQRYKAVLAVIGEVRTVADVALQWRVDRRTVHRWLARYEAGGLEGLGDRSHKPVTCPHQMPAAVAASVLELRRTQARPATYWSATSCSSSGGERTAQDGGLDQHGRDTEEARWRHGQEDTGGLRLRHINRRSHVTDQPYPTSAIRNPIWCKGSLLQSHGFELVRQWLR